MATTPSPVSAVAASTTTAITSTHLDPHRPLATTSVLRGWESKREEYAYFLPPADIEGTIPAELVGTVFRNGPGITEVYGKQLNHHIDGDGVICAISFLPSTDGTGRRKVHFRSRFVRTEHHVEEEHQRKFLYRGQMGTQTHSWVVDSWRTFKDTLFGRVTPLNYRNPSNTNVVYWGGKVLSLYETGLPYSLDPRTLVTLGADSLNGALDIGTMAAHFRYDAVRDRLIVISLRPGLRFGSTLKIVEFDRQWRVLQSQNHRIPNLNYAHDFALFEHHYVFHITPFVKITREKVLEIATGMSSPGEQMKYYPDLPSRMVIIPRDPAHAMEYRMFDVDPCHIFHFGTSKSNYRTSSSASSASSTSPAATSPADVISLEFSAVCLPKAFAMFPSDVFLSNGDTAPGKLCYFVLPFGAEKTLVHQVELDSASCEFPSTHPYQHGRGSRYSWIMANARGANLPFRDIVKVDEHAALKHAAVKATQPKSSSSSKSASSTTVASSSPRPSVTSTHKVWFSHGIVGEPIFIPRIASAHVTPAEEDDGWLFVQCYVPESHTTDLVILDARNPQAGPVATIHLKHHVPYGFHGTFTPVVFFEDSVDGVTPKVAPSELRSKL